MEVIEMDDVVLNVLYTFDDIAQNSRVVRNLNSEGIFDSSHGAECMDSRSDTANALGHDPGFARIASLQDDLDPAEHGAGCPCIRDHAFGHLNFDAQVSF